MILFRRLIRSIFDFETLKVLKFRHLAAPQRGSHTCERHTLWY